MSRYRNETGTPMTSVERSPCAGRRRADRARRQQARWAAKAGPVVTTMVSTSAAPVRSWPAKLAARCYWCAKHIGLGEPIARLSTSARDGWYGCPECVAAAKAQAKAEPP